MGKIDSVVEETAISLLRLAVTRVPRDVVRALREAYKREKSEMAKVQLANMLKNIELAEKTGKPACQDTGLITFFVKAGETFPGLGKVPAILTEAVRRATKEIPLRPNAVDPISGVNSEDNTGVLVPTIYWEIVEGDALELTAFPRGGGAESVSRLFMLKPIDGGQKLKELVLNTVIEVGAQPCPPTMIGIGIAGEGTTATMLAKKANLRRMDERNANAEVARMERDLLKAINRTGIGPMGIGGDTTALDVHIDYAHRHPATYAVGIAFQCYLGRRASARIRSSGEVELLTIF